MAQLHFFNPTQAELHIELPKRGNPNFKNKYSTGKTKCVRIPIAYLSKVDSYIKSLESNESDLVFIPQNEVCKVSINSLTIDANRFQYKLIHGSTGSTGSLRG